MSKRGSWVGAVLHPAFEVFIAIVVLVVMLQFIHGLGEKTQFEKRFLATDLALLMDAIPAMPQPGNLYTIYVPQRHVKFNTSYSFNFTKNAVAVGIEKDTSPFVFHFTPEPGMPVREQDFAYQGAMIVPVIHKLGKEIIVDDANKATVRYLPEILSCDGPRFAGTFDVKPVHAAGPELPAEQALAQVVQGQVGGGVEGSLMVKIGSTPADAVFIKAYVHGENAAPLLAQSQRVGCEIANAVLALWEKQGIEVKGIAVIPINPTHTATKDDDVLEKGKVGVLLELGTLQRKGLFDDLAQQRAAGLAIVDGVQHARS